MIIAHCMTLHDAIDAEVRMLLVCLHPWLGAAFSDYCTSFTDLAVGCLVELTMLFGHVCQTIFSALLPRFGSGVGSLQDEGSFPRLRLGGIQRVCKRSSRCSYDNGG
jgi:hypothetical protein